MIVEKFKNAWKEITLLSTWIATVVGTFIIPLPSWTNSPNTSQFYIKFIIFFATIIAGFLILHTFRKKIAKYWSKLSVIFFLFLTLTTIFYYYFRETATLPYEGKDIIIGDVRIANDPLTKIENNGNFPVSRTDIMKHFQGESERVWTKESINKNRIILILLLAITYTIAACFIISFCNLFILYKENNQSKVSKKKKPQT
ncbi:hypothetical protein [Winogradskyella haliclonae]|uniref:DUF4199 domain-containing protein n=1 Tax=Winogradskyella haliclonae TaxID=2048558 RepID=A0ABQ2C288_9FLAO|nr:hypothetical protein [Winogradskyella haliclonae]GGI58494.1 hypothetical protein GCM10011444_28030 [Winogradskyella haliclonae]